ncbi:MAG TPA: Cd(II)/Pb(II)-responsive transcriptional regulator [Burkholderiales bacterium]|nr:Cd(II)/Pb(II)-responsive transcriptional regulator [Burkholderiales bacterium]
MRYGMKIGELAARAHCDATTIRYYEQAGLLPQPERSSGNYRLYDDAHIDRLNFIRHCRSLDMTLDEIRTLLRFCDAPDKDCIGVNALLDEHIGHVSLRIAELKQLQRQLHDLRQRCDKAQTVKDCGIVKRLSAGTAPGTRRGGHVHGAHDGHRR